MRVLFLGTGDVGLPALRWLLREHDVVAVVTQPDKPVGRKQELTPPPTKRLALEHGVPVLQPKRIREPAAVAELAALQPEVIVVMAYGQILPKAILDLPRLACLNLHASLLPAHRGAAPIQASILAGDRESGIAVMWMDEGLDTGDIMLLRPLLIRRRETGGTLHDRLADLAPEALAEAMQMLALGTAPRFPQDAARATYAVKLSRASGVIDWNATARGIERQVRAMNPWPASSTLLPDPAGGVPRKLKVFSVIPFRRASGEPGTVLRVDPRGILVAAGEGAVLLREVQLEGKRRMPVHDFLPGHPIALGTRLQ
ncbi:MAG: methionyl-tRNA formyltransferase [Verrucomicrobia bacterium]|nr:methionyl-tRNA formyltransferase [Verrucomicrobiota bacterium]